MKMIKKITSVFMTFLIMAALVIGSTSVAVSYTHLDVYKRQPLSASQPARRSGSTGVDHTHTAADHCISGRLPHGKRENTGYDRTADAGRSGIYLYGCDQTGG